MEEALADHRFQQALGYVAMSDDYKIYVDAAQPATLNEGRELSNAR